MSHTRQAAAAPDWSPPHHHSSFRRHLAPTMNSGEVFDRASPGPASSASAPASVQAEPCVVRIPGRMMLDLLLEELGLPAARYSRRGYLNNTMSFTILFWTSIHNNGSCRTQMSITGVRSSDEAAAEDSASFEAIRTIENATNTVVKDLNYGRLNRMERDFGYLRLGLNGYLYVVRYMTAFLDQLHNVIAHAFPPTRIVDKSTNEALKNIEVVAHNLKDRSNSLENKLYVLRRQSQAREHEVFAPVAFFREARKRKGRDV